MTQYDKSELPSEVATFNNLSNLPQDTSLKCISQTVYLILVFFLIHIDSNIFYDPLDCLATTGISKLLAAAAALLQRISLHNVQFLSHFPAKKKFTIFSSRKNF